MRSTLILTKEYSLEEIEDVCSSLLPLLLGKKVLFYAPMGAGKTTLIKELLRNLQIEGNVQSPTFSILNEYFSNEIQDFIYHFDLYRIEKEEELIQIGFEDYLDENRTVLIEWAERLEYYKPHDALCVEIKINGLNSRVIRISRLN